MTRLRLPAAQVVRRSPLRVVLRRTALALAATTTYVVVRDQQRGEACVAETTCGIDTVHDLRVTHRYTSAEQRALRHARLVLTLTTLAVVIAEKRKETRA